MAAKQTSFFQEEKKNSEESKVQNHFQGHHHCILNVVHSCFKWSDMHPCNVVQIIKIHNVSHFYWSFN